MERSWEESWWWKRIQMKNSSGITSEIAYGIFIYWSVQELLNIFLYISPQECPAWGSQEIGIISKMPPEIHSDFLKAFLLKELHQLWFPLILQKFPREVFFVCNRKEFSLWFALEFSQGCLLQISTVFFNSRKSFRNSSRIFSTLILLRVPPMVPHQILPGMPPNVYPKHYFRWLPSWNLSRKYSKFFFKNLQKYL